jgi:hypothetical protein
MARKIFRISDQAYQAFGPFRTNIEEFVELFGAVLDLKNPNVQAWSVEVADDDGPSTTLLVCQEVAACEPPVCDQCRIIGEGSFSSILVAVHTREYNTLSLGL